MASLLAIASAMTVGTADFLGGLASRRGRVMAVVIWSHLVGVLAVLGLAPLFEGPPQASDMGWGALSGIGGGLGVLSLYAGFATSRVGVVAPTSAVVAASSPVAFGLISGERPGAVAMVGLLIGIAAIALVSRPRHEDPVGSAQQGLMFGVGAGIGFGGLFIFLSRADQVSGIWPLLPGRLSGAIVVAAFALVLHRAMWPVSDSWRPLGGAAVLAVVGNGLFLLAAQRGLLSLVAVLTSMFPVATVAWARLVFKERLGRAQIAGFAMALVAVALIVGSR